LQRRHADFVRFNTEDWPAKVKLTWREAGPDALRFPTRTVTADQIRAVWYRRPVPPQILGLDPERARWAEREAREALDGLWRTLDARWVNPPLAEAEASSKPEQLRRARALGLAVPETLVTNDPQEAEAFTEAGPTICKPLGRGALSVEGEERVFFTRLLTTDDIANLSTIGPEPYLFQRLVPKQYDVRVVVIGAEVFAVAIHSQGNEETVIDWRRADASQLPHEVVELPPETSAACVGLLAHYGLSFGAIDLAIDTEGRPVFFEINPSGQWAWLEQLTGVPLRERLASLLISA
jgi:glutathione synthase/RimK-type ligase-like ATP-grasp enzyme